MLKESAAPSIGAVKTTLGYLPLRLGLILILSLTCGSLATIAAVWWYYKVQNTETEAAATRQLFAVAQGKSDQIADWRHEQVGEGRVVMSTSVMRIARRVLSSRAAIADDRAEVLDLMARLSSQFLYSDATLVDSGGSVTIRLHEETTEDAQFSKPFRGKLAREAVQAGDVILSDLSLDTRTGRALMALTVPVDNLGALILEIDPSRFLYPCLELWPGSSRTAETLLVRLEGNEIVNLSKMRNAPGNALFSRRPKTLKAPSQAIVKSGWPVASVDYRGVPTIGVIRRVPDSPWLIVCKIDLAEVQAPLRRLAWEMVLITALIGLANAAGAGLIWKGQQARVHHEREAWFYAVANDTPAYLWMWSAGEENSFINRSLAKFLGTDKQRLSKGWTDYVHPEDAGRTHANLLESVAAGRGYTQELRIRRFDGVYRWVVSEAVPRHSLKGELMGFAGSVIDITDRKQAEEKLRSANTALVRQLEDQIRKEQTIQALGARLIGAQEEERKRLARELHDDLNQQIAALSIAMGNLKRHLPEQQADARSQTDRIHQKLVHVAETVRRMSHELHPAMLQYSGLAAALQSYCREFGALTNIDVSLTIEGDCDSVPSGAALCLYRVTQEALRNIAKHAKVTAAAVQIRHADGLLSLAVSDTGVGMETASAEASAGLGLVSIRERARLAGGSVEIESKLNQGTTITVRISD